MASGNPGAVQSVNDWIGFAANSARALRTGCYRSARIAPSASRSPTARPIMTSYSTTTADCLDDHRHVGDHCDSAQRAWGEGLRARDRENLDPTDVRGQL